MPSTGEIPATQALKGAGLSVEGEQSGWLDSALPHVLLTDPYEGISHPEFVDELRQRLAQLASAPLPPSASP
ncbi:MAG: hypothetical protein Q8N51_15270 [Gammaproteobacteria bacterium]|nr:hypothetical protein [Gammaproteobacteria bacterium]